MPSNGRDTLFQGYADKWYSRMHTNESHTIEAAAYFLSTEDVCLLDFLSSCGPDRLINAAPMGAVSSMQSTAIVRICIPHLTFSSVASLARAVSYAVEPINACINKTLLGNIV